jgi:hypothetical protein
MKTSPKRIARVDAAMRNFGLIVLQEAKIAGSVWGPFDAYCSNQLDGSSLIGGWVSQGYKPTAGENCEVQHNPQYGGEHMQVSADVIVGAKGEYTDHITGVGINNDSCAIDVDATEKVPVVIIDRGPTIKTIDGATTLAQAEAFDNRAIDCLDHTRP